MPLFVTEKTLSLGSLFLFRVLSGQISNPCDINIYGIRVFFLSLICIAPLSASLLVVALIFFVTLGVLKLLWTKASIDEHLPLNLVSCCFLLLI